MKPNARSRNCIPALYRSPSQTLVYSEAPGVVQDTVLEFPLELPRLRATFIQQRLMLDEAITWGAMFLSSSRLRDHNLQHLIPLYQKLRMKCFASIEPSICRIDLCE